MAAVRGGRSRREPARVHNVCAIAGPSCGRRRSANLVCRYHGWAYNWGGSLRSARDFGDTPAIDPGALGLAEIRVQRWRNLVWVCLDADAPPLAQALGSFPDQCAEFPMEEFRFTDRPCSMEDLCDNYLGIIPIVHPELNREIDVGCRVEVFEPGSTACTAPPGMGRSTAGDGCSAVEPRPQRLRPRHERRADHPRRAGPHLVVYQRRRFWADPDDLANERRSRSRH
jgi:hypothetical protein